MYSRDSTTTFQTFVGKVMSLLLMSLPRSKRILISWLQSPSAVILEPKKIKLLTVSIVSPFICHEDERLLLNEKTPGFLASGEE